MIRLWMHYLLYRLLLVVRDILERLGLFLCEEVPDAMMGYVHSFALYRLYLLWTAVNATLYELHNYLHYESNASEIVWLPQVDFYQWGMH